MVKLLMSLAKAGPIEAEGLDMLLSLAGGTEVKGANQ
jgi:hypothetical protein